MYKYIQRQHKPISVYWRPLRQDKPGTSGNEEINSLKFVIVTQWVQIPFDQSLVSRSIEKSEGKPGNRSPKPDVIENVGIVLSFENNINCGQAYAVIATLTLQTSSTYLIQSKLSFKFRMAS